MNPDRFIMAWMAQKTEMLMNDESLEIDRTYLMEALLEDIKLAANGEKIHHLQNLHNNPVS